MQDLSLEKEFEIYKQLHKVSVVEAQLQVHYNDLAKTGVVLPDFMDKDPNLKAREHLLMLLNDKDKFERTYNSIWESIKYAMP